MHADLLSCLIPGVFTRREVVRRARFHASASIRVCRMRHHIGDAFLTGLLMCWLAQAQAQGQEPHEPRVALIIANFDYPGGNDRLSGPLHDADVLRRALHDRGFVGVDGSDRVNPIVNASLQKIKDSVNAFIDRMNKAGPLAVGLIYFSGHGTAAPSGPGQDLYLLPTDVPDVSTADAARRGVGLKWIVNQLKQIRSRQSTLIVIVDACRSTALSPPGAAVHGQGPITASAEKPEGVPEPSDGMLIALSASAGQVASDSGIFSDALEKYIKMPGLKIDDVFNDAKLDVAKKTQNRQIPFVGSKVTQTLCLAGCYVQAAVGPDAMTVLQSAVDHRSAGDTGQIAAIENLVNQGKSLARLDLRAVYLAGAHLDGADLTQSRFSAATLDGVSLQKAKVSDTSFYFTRMQGLHAAGADMGTSRFYFADASKADFSDLQGGLSNWQAATLRGANFRHADLHGANFMMADVRDADFTGADLRGAFFDAAFIAGAKFDEAKMDNTDFGAAVGSISQFSRQQRSGICGTSSGGRTAFNYTVRRHDPNAGVYDQFKDLFSEWVPLRDGARYLAVCKPRAQIPDDQPPIWSTGPGEALYESFAMNVPHEVVDASGRRDQIVSRGRAVLGLLLQPVAADGFVSAAGK